MPQRRAERTLTRETAFGRTLRRFRQLAALSQEELAERAGLSVKAIGALERGERRYPYPHTLDVLARALDLGVDDRRTLVAAAADQSAIASSVSPEQP
jgi:transcriptional regulator with XRE-family HTH domain